MLRTRLVYIYFEGFRPEWYTSTMIYIHDTPFWPETLDILQSSGKNRCVLEIHYHVAGTFSNQQTTLRTFHSEITFEASTTLTVKYLVSAHYHVSAHPLLPGLKLCKGDVPSKRPPPPPPPPYFREEDNETINLNGSASGNRKLSFLGDPNDILHLSKLASYRRRKQNYKSPVEWCKMPSHNFPEGEKWQTDLDFLNKRHNM